MKNQNVKEEIIDDDRIKELVKDGTLNNFMIYQLEREGFITVTICRTKEYDPYRLKLIYRGNK